LLPKENILELEIKTLNTKNFLDNKIMKKIKINFHIYFTQIDGEISSNQKKLFISDREKLKADLKNVEKVI
jgi:hypothetical protein